MSSSFLLPAPVFSAIVCLWKRTHMTTAPFCHIELFAGNANAEDVRPVLAEAGYDVGMRGLQKPLAPAQLFVVDADGQVEQALGHCRRLRDDERDGHVPILLVAPADPTVRRASLEAGADALLTRPFEPAVLLAAVQSLLRVKARHDQLARQAAEAHGVSQRLQ